MLIIGLTGGIGSGKTTVANLFQKKGIEIIDTDIIARDVVERGTKAYEKIVAKFGDSILAKDGTLDRTKLREAIYKNPQDKLWLENLLHPIIRETANKAALAAKSPYAIIVIPLLVETEPNPLINRVLVVDTTTEEQISRSTQRDNLSKNQISKIIATQASRDERLNAADDVITNNKSISQLQSAVDEMHKFYLSLSR